MATMAPFMSLSGGTPSSGATTGLAADLCTRWDRLREEQSLHQIQWQEIIDYVLPGHADITRGRAQGASRTDKLFDTTAISALQTLAASMMGGVTNSFFDWLKTGFRYQGLTDNQEANAWLAEVDRQILSALGSSNFYQAAHTYYLHLGAFGMAAMYADTLHRLARDGTLEAYLRFKTLPVGTYAIAENADGQVDTLFRLIPLTPRQCLQLFGAECSRQTREAAFRPDQMDRPRPVLHCVYPRGDDDQEREGNWRMPFASIYLEYETRHICDESGYEEFPFFVSRWETVGSDPYGFGPGHMALPDIRTVNFVSELQLRQLLLWVQPPLKARQEGVVGQVSLEPLAVNVLTEMDNLDVLRLEGRPDLVKIEQQELRTAIRQMFFADALQALPPADASKMTAYEVAQRLEQMQRLMGPAFQRLLTEFLDPLVDRVFGLLWRAGVLPPVPEIVLWAAAQNQGNLDVEYEGPLAKAQKGATVRSISETLAVATQMSAATGNMDVWDVLDLDGLLREVGMVNGTPRQFLIDTAQVERLRAQRKEEQAAVLQMQMENERLKSMAPMLKSVQGLPGMQQGMEAVA